MKVLHVHSGNLYGGVETTLMAQVRNRHLCPKMELSFAICFEGRLSRELRSEKARVTFLGNCRIRNPMSVHRARARLRGLLREYRYDIAIVHSGWSQSMFGNVISREGVRLLTWVHNPIKSHHWLQRWAARTTPDRIICNSRFTAASVRSKYPQVRHHVIYNPLVSEANDSRKEDGREVRESLGISKDAVILIQVSRMEEWKGHRLLFESLVQLKDIPNWVCLQVGGAQRAREIRYVNELKALVNEYGLSDKIMFLGQRADVPVLLAASDIFCQTNTGPEPFGNVFIEAMVAELPVVTISMGGALEIVNKTCGVLLPPNDPSAVAEALSLLIANPEKRKALGYKGSSRAIELCGLSTQIEKTVSAFQSIIDECPPKSSDVTYSVPALTN